MSMLPSSDLDDVGRLQALGTLGDVELHRLALRERAEPIPRDRAVVYEHIGPVFAGDESVPLGIIEPLHVSLRRSSHTIPSLPTARSCASVRLATISLSENMS